MGDDAPAPSLDDFLNDTLDLYRREAAPGTFNIMRRVVEDLRRTPGVETVADLADPGLIGRFHDAGGWLHPRTRKNMERALRTLIRHAVRRGLIPSDPHAGKKWWGGEAPDPGSACASTPDHPRPPRPTHRSVRMGDDAPAPSLDDFLNDTLGFYLEHRSKDAYYQMRQTVDALLRTPGVETVADLADPGLIGRFHDANGWACESTRAVHNNHFRTLIRHAVRRGAIAADPYEGMPWAQTRRKDTIRIPATEQVVALLAHARITATSWTRHRDYAVVATVVYCGLTIGDVVRLRIADLDLSGRLIHAPGRRTPIPMLEPLAEVLTGWLPQSGSPWAFPSVDRSGSASAHSERHSLARMAAKVGSPDLTFMALRRFREQFVRELPDLGPQGAPPSAWPANAAVVLGGPDDPPVVAGEVMPRLKTPLWRVALEVLLEAGPEGLPSGELERRCGLRDLNDPFRVIRELRKDPRWERAITTPGKPNGGNYRICTLDEFVDTTPARPENSQSRPRETGPAAHVSLDPGDPARAAGPPKKRRPTPR